MTVEQSQKLLAALGVKTGTGAGELAEADAVKLIEDAFAAGNLGLIQKRDELLGSETKLKEKITLLETGAAETSKKMADLDAQLKKNNPKDYQDYYEGLAKTEAEKNAKAMEALAAERDKYKDSHYARVQSDAVNEAVKDLQFVDGLKDGFIALAMQRNRFSPKEIDGKTIFTNQDNKTLQAVLHELSLAQDGKAYLKSGNAGGGSGGSASLAGNGNSLQMNRSQFMGMNEAQKMEFATKGGSLIEG